MPPVPAAVPTVVLALPDPLRSSALAAALPTQCEVVATAASWEKLEDALDTHRPAVVVLDVVVGTDRVLPHRHQLVTARAPTRFVVCSPHPDPVLIQRALRAGASAVVGHDAEPVNVFGTRVDGQFLYYDRG